eukprot:TRINITY_DN9655_c0_g1_i1.p1 TRINITY_DN9655_c0_g1~~TRINITY_DN9655_c0_g1_i1.p1  ORF type:complete len:139 (-),score=32.73 TRINITY_DN9655_c0_g1_i1:189-605(-)
MSDDDLEIGGFIKDRDPFQVAVYKLKANPQFSTCREMYRSLQKLEHLADSLIKRLQERDTNNPKIKSRIRTLNYHKKEIENLKKNQIILLNCEIISSAMERRNANDVITEGIDPENPEKINDLYKCPFKMPPLEEFVP